MFFTEQYAAKAQAHAKDQAQPKAQSTVITESSQTVVPVLRVE